ncbi:YvcK family protein [Candidatus Kaiserbacteria bacterium]|nr:YvcK family protein [Candidatus Kaiserbacteria bacterium]
MEKRKVVVIGGGTGTHTVLKGLKKFKNLLDISAIVTMADSGGSTGRLRDEFGYLPVGDVRMALTALAQDTYTHEELLRELFLYRFDKGKGLSGHNFGNLLLVALTDILGSEEKAIRATSELLRVQGKVLPVTNEKVHLVAEYDDGSKTVGEHEIDDVAVGQESRRIIKLSVTPEAKINDSAKQAILGADLVVLGPGDLYTSVLANCVVGGVVEALRATSAKLAYVSNLMTRFGQTDGMTVAEHVEVLAEYIGCYPNVVLVNSMELPGDLAKRYAGDKEYPVELGNITGKFKLIQKDLLAREEVETVKGDTLRRSLIRHDSDKLAKEIINLV